MEYELSSWIAAEKIKAPLTQVGGAFLFDSRKLFCFINYIVNRAMTDMVAYG